MSIDMKAAAEFISELMGSGLVTLSVASSAFSEGICKPRNPWVGFGSRFEGLRMLLYLGNLSEEYKEEWQL